jgi:methyl-accepting chemotaxis protein
MKLQTRLLLSFTIVAALCAVVGLVGWRGIAKTSNAVEMLTETNLPEVEGLGLAMEGLCAVKGGQRTMLIKGIPHKERASELGKNLKRMDGLDEGWKLYSSTQKEAEEQAMVKETSAALTAWKADNDKFNSLVRSLRTEEGANNEAAFAEMQNLAFGDMRVTFGVLDKKLDELSKKSVEMAHQEGEIAAATATGSTIISIVAMLVGIVASMAMGFVIARRISLPVLQGVDLAEEIAKGVFTSRIRLNRQDEIGQLAAALDHMAETLASQVEVARTIANGDLTCKVELASPQDTLGQALQAMQQNLSDTISQTKMAGEEIANGAL